MEILKNRILEDGYIIGEDILKVDNFLNHQIDVKLFNEIGKEFKNRFKNDEVTKILTVEASGIGIACIAAQYFDVPVVFAKKHAGTNMEKETYEAAVYSFTKNTTYSVRVAKKFIQANDKILIIDDFLANGNAVLGLANIVEQAGAKVTGVGIVIEKAFQKGREVVEAKGLKVEALASIQAMKNGKIIFKD